MGKKRSYKLKEYERYEKRVDVFRSVQQPAVSKVQFTVTSAPAPKMMLMRGSNAYTNKSFFSSELEIEQNSNKKSTSSENVEQSVIWTTDLKDLPDSSIPVTRHSAAQLPVPRNSRAEFYPPINQRDDLPIKLNRSTNVLNSDRNTFSKKPSQKRKWFFCCAFLMIVTIFILLGLLIFLVLKHIDLLKKSTPVLVSINECSPECDENYYCVQSSDSTETKKVRPTCECKPGYKVNNNGMCEKAICYDNYYPYTFINTYVNYSSIPLPQNTKNLKPYCCPNSNYLSTSCCGVSKSQQSQSLNTKRIIGGKIVTTSLFPWLVYVTQLFRPNSAVPLKFMANCSGSLISDRVVLTAAHCTEIDTSIVTFNAEFPSLESTLKVYFGLNDLSKVLDPKTAANHQRAIRKVIIHPLYNRTTFENDLALLYLDSPINREDDVDYICLFNYGQDDSRVQNRLLYAAGWGSTSPNFNSLSFPDLLYYIDLIVYPMSSCTYIFPDAQFSFFFNSSTHVCAGHENVPVDTCYGDSGTPLMVQYNNQWFAYGILSYGSQPDCAKGPAMYTRIAYYHDWISSNII